MRIRTTTLLLLVSPFVLPVVVAYIQWATVGLPAVPPVPSPPPDSLMAQGFPAWLRVTHYINFLFIILLIRSGLQILMDHPRLYWNVHCTPGTEWIRFTPIEVPQDKSWTAKDDSRYLSPWIGLPGYRHTIGMARHWHFLSVLFWVGNGFVYVVLLFGTGQWKRLVPTSWQIVPDAWAYFVHYVTFHIPPEPDTFSRYNALQQLSYFGVIFILAPLAILTGPSMSPALTNRFKWYPNLPGNRQIGRSLHFLIMCAFVLFVVGHVAMVMLTGFAGNMNHIVVGANDTMMRGLYLGIVGIGVVVAVNVLANWLAPLTGVIETDWLPYPFTMNWQLTRPGVVKFEKDEPFCLVFPVLQNALEDVRPEIINLESDSELAAQHEAWREKRDEFMSKFRAGDPATLKEAWQKYYFKGILPDGNDSTAKHVQKLRLEAPLDRRTQPRPPLITNVIVSSGSPGSHVTLRNNGARKRAIAKKTSVTRLPNAKQLDILMRPDFLPAEECDELIAAFERCQDQLGPAPGRTDKFFDNRFLWINSLPTSTERRAKQIMQATRFRAIGEITRFYHDRQPLYSDTIQLVKWPEGKGMPVHADNSNPDGSAHPTAHRKYASVVYLNDDYRGGELFLPALGVEIKPKKGLLVAFRGDRSHEHGVRPVTQGIRYTMPGWYTDDISHQDPLSQETY